MPIYECQCRLCGRCFEKLVFSSDEQARTKCPKCRQAEVRNLR